MLIYFNPITIESGSTRGSTRVLDRTSFFRIDKALSSLLFVASAGRFTGYDPG
jgi:hypothetical protein